MTHGTGIPAGSQRGFPDRRSLVTVAEFPEFHPLEVELVEQRQGCDHVRVGAKLDQFGSKWDKNPTFKMRSKCTNIL